MREIWTIEGDIRKIEKRLKKVMSCDLKDGDYVFFDPFQPASGLHPFEVRVCGDRPVSGVPNVEIGRLNPRLSQLKIGPKHLKQLLPLIDELAKAVEEQDRLAEERKRNEKRQHQRYVVWNYVYDFGGVEDRDGFLIEIFDGWGKLLLRNVWAKMECGGTNEDINEFCGPSDNAEDTFVKFMARIACEGERIKPVIVFCDKID